MHQHPEHDAVSREVRRWYTSAIPEIGLTGTTGWFGFAAMMDEEQARVTLSIADPAQVPAALTAALEACPANEFLIMVDDRERAARLDAALREHGCRYQESVCYLALTGPIVSPVPGPDRLEIAVIGPADLQAWARVKRQSFDDSEDAPPTEAVSAEVALRLEELSITECQLASLDGEPVAVLAHYPGDDDLVFILGTRLPYRHRGIAQSMLARWAAAAHDGRSRMINAIEGGAPEALYRRLGFTDEVYWQGKYSFTR